jgi:hypothetical protein
LSKKRFTEGLESIFGADAEETLQENSPLLASTTVKEKDKNKENPRSTAKNFSADLQSFLQEAFEESFDQQLEKKKTTTSELKSKARVKKRYKRPRSGLDLLIRNTIEPDNIRLEPKKSKRVTITFDPGKLEKLKDIARKKKSYLRDVIDEIVADYLATHKDKK